MTPFALDHPAVARYLARLDAATSHLPMDERMEIGEGIRSHLITALAEVQTEAEVLTALDALGDPEEIVSPPMERASWPTESRVALPPPPVRSARGALEIAAVILLLVGAFIVPFIGWFVGVVLLWVSKAWTTPEKVLGTLVLPGGLAVAPALIFLVPFAAETCAGTTTTAGVIAGTTTTTGVMTFGPGCSGGLPLWATIVVLVFVVAAPIISTVYLLRAAGRRPAAT